MNNRLALMLVAGLLVACGPSGELRPDVPDLVGKPAAKAAKVSFASALSELASHDRANDWSTAVCEATAKQFLVAAELLKRAESPRTQHLSARYNAALAFQRCQLTDQSKAVLTALLDDEPSFHRAAAQLAMYRFEATGNIDQGISDLEQVVSDSQFKNVDALVGVATLLLRRGSAAVDENGDDDHARARLNLQRALAVDDGHMPALNQLAILYLHQAGTTGDPTLQVASASDVRAKKSHATLELAALICSQAILKNPEYAPVHNTAGLVHTRLGDLSAAAKSFERARALAPDFFEAHMNYAAVNLQFRGFQNAQNAYERALEIQPKSYDALLGLSLALRGQVGEGASGDFLGKAEQLLQRAKALDASRPEAWFNSAILLQEFRARGLPPAEAKAALLKAKNDFGEFLSRAEKQPAFADARTRAQERMRDIDEMLIFISH